MKKFQLNIEYRFEAEDYHDAARKARDLGFLDESDEVEVGDWEIAEKQNAAS